MKKILFLFICFTSFLFADATIEIIKRMDKLPTIQLQDASGEFIDSDFKNKFYKVLLADFKVTTYFEVLENYTQVNYDDIYRSGTSQNDLKADIILRYKLSIAPDNSILATVRLIDSRNAKLKNERVYKISKMTNYPFLAHTVTMSIVESLELPKIDWMGRHIIFSRYTSPKESEIVIADYTLTFQQVLVKGGLNIFPKWADNTQDSFYYTSYNLAKPTLYKITLKTGAREQIISSNGMLVVSDVSKDTNRLLLTMAPKDQTDIYMYNLRNKQLTQITNFSGVDISGSFIEDESKIIFVSDRLGYPNIFAQKIGETRVEQMVYHGRNNAAASTFGNYIVYSSRDKSSEFSGQTFNLYLISTKTDYIRQLTATGKNLYPRFSNDGESVIFIKEFASESAIGIIRLGANKSFHFPLRAGKIQSIDW
ncbi:MAG: Tol-Pal system protein TolB [Campylobacteraceae bacterium]